MITNKDIVWGIVLSVVVLVLATWISPDWLGSLPGALHPDVAAKLPNVTPAVLDAELAKIEEAENIGDVVQRCLAYPNPAEFHWDPKVVNVFCQLLSRRRMERKEIESALDDNHADLLQQTFDAYLAKTYEPGQHGLLTWVFKDAFSNLQRGDFETIQRWVAADPASSYALAARGTYYVAAAWAARGVEVARDTPGKKLDRMHDFAEKARGDLQESLRRNPRLIAAYHGLLQVAQITSDRDLLQTSVERALALDPADQSIYTIWMNALEPKWGGSVLEMEGVIQEAKRHAGENPLLSRLQARPACYRAENAESDIEALELYRLAATLGPAPCFLAEAANSAERAGQTAYVVLFSSQAYRFLGTKDPLFRRALALQRLGRAQWGLRSIDRLLKEQPANIEALNYRGWILAADNQPAEAEKSFLTALDLDPANREAASELVSLYTRKSAQPAKAREIVDRMMSIDPGNSRAWLLQSLLYRNTDKAKCRADLLKYLELVDQKTRDSYEQRDIRSAKALLAKLKAEEP